MAHKVNKNQSSKTTGNEYEKLRQLRVQENQKRLRELGVKNLANSLTSLVESQKKNRKRKKITYTNRKDVDYVPSDMDYDSDEDLQEVAKNANQVSKKQHRPIYISPMSIKQIANLSKLHRRVNAPHDSKTVSSGSNATKASHQQPKVTMGELISGSKGGPKRKMVLVDEDDDEGDTIFKGVNELGMELDGVSDDEDEFDIQDNAAQDDRYEDMEDMIHTNNENEIELENDNNVQEQLHGSELEKAKAISKSRNRGPTMLHAVHMRSAHERKVIICNEYGQPIGPVTSEKDVVGEFSRFLGTIARNYDYAPLVYSSWHKVPNKDRMWQYVSEKYDVPNVARGWVLMTIGHAYKVHKCRFKKKHFYQYKDNKTRWKNRPKNIKDDDFSKLLTLWNNKKEANRCLRAKEARLSQKNMHTAGPKSFARIREEMRNDDPNKLPPSLSQMFEHTRKRTEGRTYADNYDDTALKIDKMKKYKPPEDGVDSLDPYTAVMNKEKNGYRRLYGRGVSNKIIKNLHAGEPVESVNKDHLLIEMQKSIEDDHEKKKAELKAIQEDQQKQKAELEEMQRNLSKQQEELLKFFKLLPTVVRREFQQSIEDDDEL